MKKVFALFLLCFSFIFFSGFGCKNENKAEKIKASLPQINLTYWRIFDDANDFTDLINAYTKDHPNVNIIYKKLRFEEYKQELVNAWSEDRGPDIFSIPTTWLGEYVAKNRLVSMPDSTTMTYEVITDAKKGTKDYVKKTNQSPTLRDIKTKYLDVVYNDVVRDGKIYGLPLAIDTLALYYNRDFGTNVKKYLFEPADSLTADNIKSDIITNCNKFITDISINGVEIIIDNDIINLTINFLYKTNNELDSISLTFNR